MSWALAREVVDVLRRPKLECYGIAKGEIDELVGVWGPLLPTVEVQVEIRDPDDAPVVATALAGKATAIITGDLDFLDDERLRAWLAERGIEVLVPAEVLRHVDERTRHV